MNKLILEEENNVLNLKKDTIITIYNTKIKKLDLNIEKNISIIINDFRIIKNNTDISININENSNITYNHSFINEDKYILNVNTNYKGENCKINFNIHGITLSGNTTIKFDGILNENKNNSLLENIRLINLSDATGIIIPNILVENNEVEANHKASIGSISHKELNYLMSKGISKKEAKGLILTGFLITIIDSDDITTQIKELLNRRGLISV